VHHHKTTRVFRVFCNTIPLDPRQWVLEVEDLNWLEIMPKHVKTMRSLVLSVSEYIQVSELSKILEELTGDFGEEG